MGPLTAGSADHSGLAHPAARWALICFFWITAVANDVVVEGIAAAPLLAVLVYTLGLAGAVGLTSRNAGPLRSRTVAVVIAAGVASAAYAVAGLDHPRQSLLLEFGVYLVAFLIPRGNTYGAAVGVTAVFGVAIGWGVATGQPATGMVELLGLPLVIVGFAVIWAVFVRVTVARERAARAASDRARQHEVAAASARDYYEEEIAAIGIQAEPLLGEIAAGAPIDGMRLRRLTIAEGDIRDRIRARDLRHPALASAVASARWRGARILLLGDDESGSSPLPSPVAERLAGVLEDPDLQSATIRRHPRGRAGVVTIVFEAAGATARLTLDERGDVA